MNKKKSQLGAAIIDGLKQAIAHQRGQIKLKTTERELSPPAPEFSKSEIKKIRVEVLHYTQLEFDSLLNVDVSTIRHWEQGLRKPSKLIYRLLQIILKKPEGVDELESA